MPRPTSAERGYDHKWRRLRAAFLRRYPLCVACGSPTIATEVDHIVPHHGQSDPLFWAWRNLQPLCKSHHSQKTSRERIGPGRGVTPIESSRQASYDCAGGAADSDGPGAGRFTHGAAATASTPLPHQQK